MTPDEYRAALKELGLTQNSFARWLGVNSVTARKWAANKPRAGAGGNLHEAGPPEPVIKMLRFMVALRRLMRLDISPQWVDELIEREFKGEI